MGWLDLVKGTSTADDAKGDTAEVPPTDKKSPPHSPLPSESQSPAKDQALAKETGETVTQEPATDATAKETAAEDREEFETPDNASADEKATDLASSEDGGEGHDPEKPPHSSHGTGEATPVVRKSGEQTPATQGAETAAVASTEQAASSPITSERGGQVATGDVAGASGSEKVHDVEKAEALAETKEAGGADEHDDTDYKSGWQLWTLSFGLMVSTFVIALDNTIIATAIPRITTQFDSLNDVGWYGSAYLLTTTSLQPSFGKIYTYFNVKWTYIIALVIFEIGSIVCAAAVNSVMLIVGRAIAGAGAAALFSGGLTIVGFSVRIERRPIYIALLASMFGISSIVGPILGGVLTDKATWRWCFWINLPFGGLAILIVFIFFKSPKRDFGDMTLYGKLREIDTLGAFFLIGAIVCLLLALQWGGSTYPWHDSRVWGCFLGFGLILIAFIIQQIRRGDRGTIPPRILIKQRTVLACALFVACLSMALYAHIYYLPFYFQAVKGVDAEQSGIRIVAYLVSNTIASIAVGGLITAVGYYVPFLWVGSAIFAVGCGLIYTLKVDSPAKVWVGYQILAGIGAGMCIQIPFTATQVVLEKKDMPTGNAITIFFNTLGGAISVSIAQNIFSNTLLDKLPVDAPTVNPLLIISAGATHIREVVTAAQLPGVLLAYDQAVTRAFVLPLATSLLAFVISWMFEWKSVKGHSLIPS